MSTPERIELTLPDGSVRSVAPGTTALEVAEEIGPGLAKAAIGAGLMASKKLGDKDTED